MAEHSEAPDLSAPLALKLPRSLAKAIMPRHGSAVDAPPVGPYAAERIEALWRALPAAGIAFPGVRARPQAARCNSSAPQCRPDPVGAAVLHCVLGHFVTAGHHFGPFLDAWLHEHGPAFAAAAVASPSAGTVTCSCIRASPNSQRASSAGDD